MTTDVQIVAAQSAAGQTILTEGARPISFVGNDKIGRILTPRGMTVNSLLRKDEWEELDAAVVDAARLRLNGVMHLRELGLVHNLGGIGSIISEWNEASEMTEADVNITGQARGNTDTVEYDLAAVPVPVIFKEYSISSRMLSAARRLGNAIDVTNAANASRVVAEKLEQMLFAGNSLVFNGRSIYGYTTHPSRNTDTASNYGGGDFATEHNGRKTVLGMIAAAHSDRMFGPYMVYVAKTQYVQLLARHTDGSGQLEIDTIRQIPGILDVHPSDWLTDGHVVLVQMTRDVVDLAVAQAITNVEWTSGDGMVGNFKVMTIAVPRIKADFAGNCGIVHATGA